MSGQSDLEQEILSCWNIVDDLEIFTKKWEQITEDQKLNFLIGIKELYNLKFGICFNTFENYIHQRK